MGLPSDSGRTKRIFRGNPVLILVLLAALGIRTALFVSLRPWDENVVERRILVEDARSYHDLATSVLETGTFEEFDTGFYLRTPGYPLFISGVFLVAGDRVWIVLLLQVIMDSLTALIVYALAREIGLSKRIGLIAAALYALAMVSATGSVKLLSDTLFTSLLLVSILLFVRGIKGKRLVNLPLSGLVLGLATLVRPFALTFVLVYLLVIFFSRLEPGRRVVGAAALLYIFMAVVVPWQGRNYRVFGRFALSNLAGTNLCRCNVALTKAYSEGISLEAARVELEGNRLAGITDPFEISDIYMGIASGYIRENPAVFAKYHVTGCMQTYATTARSCLLRILGIRAAPCDVMLLRDGPTVWAAARLRAAEREYFIGPVLFLGQLIIYAAAILGLYLMMRGRQRLYAILFILTIAFFTMVPGVFSLCRFRIPAIPLYMIAAAGGLSHALDTVRRKYGERTGRPEAALNRTSSH